jgi:hypothetical protein
MEIPEITNYINPQNYTHQNPKEHPSIRPSPTQNGESSPQQPQISESTTTRRSFNNHTHRERTYLVSPWKPNPKLINPNPNQTQAKL